MKKCIKVLFLLMGNAVLPSVVLAVSGGGGDLYPEDFAFMGHRGTVSFAADFAHLGNVHNANITESFAPSHDDDDGDERDAMVTYLLGLLANYEIQDVLAGGVTQMIQDYEGTVDGMGLVRLYDQETDWLRAFMHIVETRLNIVWEDQGDWVLIQNEIVSLADELNHFLRAPEA